MSEPASSVSRKPTWEQWGCLKSPPPNTQRLAVSFMLLLSLWSTQIMLPNTTSLLPLVKGSYSFLTTWLLSSHPTLPGQWGPWWLGNPHASCPERWLSWGGGPRPSCPKEHLGKHPLHVPQLCGRGSALSNCLPAMRRKLPAYKSMELAERKANQGQNAQRLREAETERDRLSQRDGGWWCQVLLRICSFCCHLLCSLPTNTISHSSNSSWVSSWVSATIGNMWSVPRVSPWRDHLSQHSGKKTRISPFCQWHWVTLSLWNSFMQ